MVEYEERQPNGEVELQPAVEILAREEVLEGNTVAGDDSIPEGTSQAEMTPIN